MDAFHSSFPHATLAVKLTAGPAKALFAQRDPKVTIDMRMRDYHIAAVGATRLRTATAWREGPNNIQGLSNTP